MSTDAIARSTNPHPSPLPQAAEGTGRSLALLREWSSVVDTIAQGRCHVLIRKGGIAEGREGFQIKRSFFGLLPTLFHQVKNADPRADAPSPPSTVSVLAQLVETFSLPSNVSMESIRDFHGYSADQLAARQSYKPERPLNLMIIRAFRLRQPVTIAPGQIRTVCRSWAEVPLESGMGGIDPVIDIDTSCNAISELQAAIGKLPEAERIG